MNQIKKIVIIGPESTGKSMLCEKLAAHYNTIWVKEYAREYLLKNGADYSCDDLLKIAQGQFQLEQKAIEYLTNKNEQETRNDFLFIDTDQYVIKIWSEIVFGKCHNWILNKIVESNYDLYLLCNVDVAWVKDELRKDSEVKERRKIYHHYKDALVNQVTPWVDISGSYEERFEKAVNAINKLLREK